MENFEKDFSFIRKKFNLNKPRHMNKSNKGNWMEYYDLDLVEKVYKKYEKDIKVFGYEKEYKKLLDFVTNK